MAFGPEFDVVRAGEDSRRPALSESLEDGSTVVVVDDCVRVARPGGETRLVHVGGQVLAACIARRARRVALNVERSRFSDDGVVGVGGCFYARYNTMLVDLDSGTVCQLEGIPAAYETALAISPDAALLATASPHGALWSIADGTQISALEPLGLVLNAMAFDGEGRRLAILSDGNPNPGAELNDSTPWKSTVGVWRADCAKVFRSSTEYKEAAYLGFSDDGRKLVALGANSRPVMAWDASTGELRVAIRRPGRFEPGRDQRVGAYRPKQQCVGVAVSGDGDVSIDKHLAPPDTAPLQGNDIFHPFAVSRAGEVAAELAWWPDGASGPAVIRWTVADGRRLPTLVTPNADAELTSLALSVDGRWLAAGGRDWVVYVWDQASGALSATLRGHCAAVHGLAFSADCETLYSASRDGVVLSWASRKGP